MKARFPSKLFIDSVMGIVLSLSFLLIIFPNKSIEIFERLTLRKEQNVQSRLKIPKLSIDTNVESVGLTSTGAVDTPKDPLPVAWFDQSAHFGEKGTTVIVGHSGWKDDIPAVFDNLSSIKKGDKIYVTNEKGKSITFVVREIKTYGSNENIPSVFVSNDGKSHLNLITCTGIWDDILKTRSDRLVVFSDKI